MEDVEAPERFTERSAAPIDMVTVEDYFHNFLSTTKYAFLTNCISSSSFLQA
jgi:hypothetical protein